MATNLFREENVEKGAGLKSSTWECECSLYGRRYEQPHSLCIAACLPPPCVAAPSLCILVQFSALEIGSRLFGGASLVAFKIMLVLAVQCPFRGIKPLTIFCCLKLRWKPRMVHLFIRACSLSGKLGHLFRGDADCKSAPRLGSRNEGKLVPITASSCLLAGELGIWDRPPRRIWGRRLGKHRVGRADI